MERIDLFKTFKIAIEKEEEAHLFYLNMAKQIEDVELKKIILDFADHEYRHMETLTELYSRMKKPA